MNSLFIVFIKSISTLFLSYSSYQPTLPKNITEGKALMEAKCVKCHTAKKVEDYSLLKWEKTLPKMIRKAKLGEADQTKIMAYIRYVIDTKK
ncbi:MAG: hypothetical protein KJ941_11530 [Bacteroidetes bacterium]|nr:hypothetical protein [Bacteroidota bacterium]